MKRISVSFYDEIYKIIEAIAKEEGLPSMAHCIRELVDLAIKLKAAAKEASQKNDKNEVLTLVSELKNLFQNNLNWVLETRLLVRYLVENHPGDDRQNQIEILKKYKKSANDYIKGLYGEKI